MEITFNGGRFAIGVPIGEVHNELGVGAANGHTSFIDGKNSSVVGVSLVINHFTFEVPCECALQAGDWIELDTAVILFIEVGSIRYNLCGGECVGKTSSGPRGVGIGLENSKIRWVLR